MTPEEIEAPKTRSIGAIPVSNRNGYKYLNGGPESVRLELASESAIAPRTKA